MALSTRHLAAPSMPSAASGAMNAEMNVTPMLDVLLVLLIIFMAGLSTRMTVEAHLPDPGAHAQSDAVPIVLEVGPRGYYALNQQVIPADSLGARIRSIYAARPDKRIMLHGARDATYQEVIHAMDVVKGAGVIAIGVEMRPTPPRRTSTAPPLY